MSTLIERSVVKQLEWHQKESWWVAPASIGKYTIFQRRDGTFVTQIEDGPSWYTSRADLEAAKAAAQADYERRILSALEAVSPAPGEPVADQLQDGRRVGKSRLVYDKASRTIVTVATGSSPPTSPGEPPKGWKLVPEGEPTTLADCPIGLFVCSGQLVLKTEYGNNEGRIDAYIVSSGEFFWGSAPQSIANQRRQIVQPVAVFPSPGSAE